ncbi:MAG: hypothetical protein JJT99_00645 [Rhodobacteraceae bacterium]|nr:hypothetical protein [Paracoccaceae bacterium]
MSRFLVVPPLLGAALVVSACSGGGSGGAGAVVSSASGVLSQNVGQQQAASQVLASRHASGKVQFLFEDGPLADMVVLCDDHSGASCSVVGGPEGTQQAAKLEGRMAGDHAYAGSLRLGHQKNGAIEYSYHRLYQATPDGSDRAPGLPGGVHQYQGDFMAGAIVDGEGGIAEGGITLLVNFDAGLLSGSMAGKMRDSTTQLWGDFNKVTIDAQTGEFAAGPGSTFTFRDAVAGGALEGGFYGPDANEAAGAFEFGVDQNNGISGVFLACGADKPNCVSHSQ